VKTLITLSCVSVLALSITACASGTTTPASSTTAALTLEQCKAHVAQFVPTQNKNDAALQKDLTCANMVKKS
jgi:hypothetical protein